MIIWTSKTYLLLLLWPLSFPMGGSFETPLETRTMAKQQGVGWNGIQTSLFNGLVYCKGYRKPCFFLLKMEVSSKIFPSTFNQLWRKQCRINSDLFPCAIVYLLRTQWYSMGLHHLKLCMKGGGARSETVLNFCDLPGRHLRWVDLQSHSGVVDQHPWNSLLLTPK